MEKEYEFIVKFKPKVSWADDIFLGNLLAEALGNIARNTGYFDFEVRKLEEKKE